MARILISYYSDYGEAMYDAITEVLRQNGNDIFRLNINDYRVFKNHWGGISKITDDKLLNDIKNFEPDVVLSYNNCLPVNCYEIIKKKCKICVLDADAPEVAFWNKKTIKKIYNRLVFLGLQSCSHTMYERYLNKKLSEKDYIYFPPATIVEREDLKKDKNISFIGSNFYPSSIPEDLNFYTKGALNLYDAFKQNYFLSFEQAKKIYSRCTPGLFEEIRYYYCGQERLKYLQQLTDLGLVFFGKRRWDKIAYYDFDLAKCYDSRIIDNIRENQDVYNSSKISVNISHPLAKTSFSWRVMDIMASSSCLVMEDKPDWRDLFERYLSEETLKSVIYKDRFDMREKVKRLLVDEELRKRCVKDLNNAIEQNGRWEMRFKKLEQFLGVQLLGIHNPDAQYIVIEREETQPKASKENGLIQRLKLKNRLKIGFYCLLLILSQIPIVDLLFKRKRREKLRRKLDKYWR